MNHSFFYLLIALLNSFLLSSCTGEEEPGIVIIRRVTLITSIGGPGDNGYNDLITDAVMKFYSQHHEMALLLKHPADMIEAEEMIANWRDEARNTKEISLLILASDSYLDLCRVQLNELPDNCKVLLFEAPHTDLPENVSTFRIGRYGSACLAGMMAAESPKAHIIAACPDDKLLLDAIEGFKDGFTSKNPEGDVQIHYLASDETGFSMTAEAYRLTSTMDEECFIFPLAGGSNSGIYKYTRESMFSLMLVAGMDVDCSKFSTRIPFSILTGIDQILLHYLDDWLVSGKMDEHNDYFIGNSDFIGIGINHDFLKNAEIFLDYYSSDQYWLLRYEKLFEEALVKEKRYYGM